MRFDVAVSGALILSAANGYAPFYGSVGVKDSRIAWVTEKTIAPSECDTWVDGTDRILMPGLVNAHWETTLPCWSRTSVSPIPPGFTP